MILIKNLLTKIAWKPPRFLESVVRHIFLEPDTGTHELSTVRPLFSACPLVINLCLDGDTHPQLLPVLGRLKCLQRLTLDLGPLFGRNAPNFTHQLFRNLTHLELLGTCSPRHLPPNLGIGLTPIPHLTHVAFNTFVDIPIIHAMVRANASLQCIVFLTTGADDMYVVFHAVPDSEDVRLVCIGHPNRRVDWVRGAVAGNDYWARADAFIAAKRSGRVTRSLYYISHEDDYL